MENISKMINKPSMNSFKKPISVTYPPNNEQIFEEWFSENYNGCNSDRQLIPAWFTSYWVNNEYGNNARMKQEMQEYVDSLDRNKKWFTIIQYDDGALIDFKDLDVLEFNMSKSIGRPLPLLCQPHPFKFKSPKKWFANFIGSRTHPVRDSADVLRNKEGYYISFDPHPIENYCRILHESIFTLCFRGYGTSSFRIAESLQYGSIPVMITDEVVWPQPKEDFVGVVVDVKDAHRIDEILSSIEPIRVVEMQDRLQQFYDTFFTYESNLKHIIKYLENEKG